LYLYIKIVNEAFMRILNCNINFSSANPANWSSESKERAVKLGAVCAVGYVALTALQMLPTALAAGSQYIYDCKSPAEVNAAAAFAKVLYDTIDYGKASQAAKFMYDVGLKVDKYISSELLTSACHAVANEFPYLY
jgi:hypothetical protein